MRKVLSIIIFCLLSFYQVSSQGFVRKKISSLEIHLNTSEGVSIGSSLPIGFEAKDIKGNTFITKNVNGYGKSVNFDDFDITVKGGVFNNSKKVASIDVNDFGGEFFYLENGNPAIEIEVSNINYKGYEQTKKIVVPLDFKVSRNISYSGSGGVSGAGGVKGSKGSKGTNGKDGQKGSTGGYGSGRNSNGGNGGNGSGGTSARDDAGRGGNGGNGNAGGNGNNGFDVVAFVNLIKGGENDMSLLRVVTLDNSGEYKGVWVQDVNHLTKINIFSNGGNGGNGGEGGRGGQGGHGGNGGDGGDGGKGGKGKKGADGGDGGYGANGAAGGNGGNGGNGGIGGNGGVGGNGGKITVYVFDEAIPFYDKLMSLSNLTGAGGTGGIGGKRGLRGIKGDKGDGGKGGSAGYAGIKNTTTDHKGSKGSKGGSGTDGPYGNPGNYGVEGNSGNTGTSGKAGATPLIIKGNSKAKSAWNTFKQKSPSGDVLDKYLFNSIGESLKNQNSK